MRKSFAYFFLNCSLILVLGHSILPHNHVENEHNACEISTSKDLSLSDIIKLALAHNLGAKHLEEFKNCKKLELTHGKSFKIFIINKPEAKHTSIFTMTKQHWDLNEHEFFSEFTYSNALLRGPPFQS
jgi:hypothetical protein